MVDERLHDRFRPRLQRLSRSDWSDRALASAAGHWREWNGSAAWRRCYGRFTPDAAPYATALLQQNGTNNLCLFEAFEHRPVECPGTVHRLDSLLGWLRLRRFPDDPSLPSLAAVLEGIDSGAVDILRYRPYKRCTFRLTAPDGNTALFGKVFADRRGDAIHRESIALRACAERGELGFDVARPRCWEPRMRVLWQHPVAGVPIIDRLFCKDGARMAARIGHAMATITTSGLRPALRFDGAAQLLRSAHYARELARLLPDCQQRLERLLDALAIAHDHRRGRPLVPLHGAPHAHQWLVAGDRLGLVDFDRVCMGDPELDAATFIAEIDFEDRASVPVDAINAAFLAAYQEQAGALDLALLQAYRAHKRLAKALKAARALRVDGDDKARRHIDFARKALSGDG